MNPLILYDLSPFFFYRFIRTWDGVEDNFFYFTNGHAGSCMYLYIQIGRSTHRLIPDIFLQILMV